MPPERLDHLALLHHTLDMGNAGGDAQHYRRIKLFAKLEGELEKLFGLGRVGRLQHRQFGRQGVVAVGKYI